MTDNEALNPIIEMLGRIQKSGSETELETDLKVPCKDYHSNVLSTLQNRSTP